MEWVSDLLPVSPHFGAAGTCKMFFPWRSAGEQEGKHKHASFCSELAHSRFCSRSINYTKSHGQTESQWGEDWAPPTGKPWSGRREKGIVNNLIYLGAIICLSFLSPFLDHTLACQ